MIWKMCLFCFIGIIPFCVAVLLWSCDEGGVTVNTPGVAPPDSSACDTVFVGGVDTVWVDCPAETVWVEDPFWACVKECEQTGANRNSRGYRDCMSGCLSDLR